MCQRERGTWGILTTQPGSSVLTSRPDWLRDAGGAVGHMGGVSLVLVIRKCLGLMGGSERRSLGGVVWETNLKSCYENGDTQGSH